MTYKDMDMAGKGQSGKAASRMGGGLIIRVEYAPPREQLSQASSQVEESHRPYRLLGDLEHLGGGLDCELAKIYTFRESDKVLAKIKELDHPLCENFRRLMDGLFATESRARRRSSYFVLPPTCKYCGVRVQIRISNHNANCANWLKRRVTMPGVGITFKRAGTCGSFKPHRAVCYEEYVYDRGRMDKTALCTIATDILQIAYKGEYVNHLPEEFVLAHHVSPDRTAEEEPRRDSVGSLGGPSDSKQRARVRKFFDACLKDLQERGLWDPNLRHDENVDRLKPERRKHIYWPQYVLNSPANKWEWGLLFLAIAIEASYYNDIHYDIERAYSCVPLWRCVADSYCDGTVVTIQPDKDKQTAKKGRIKWLSLSPREVEHCGYVFFEMLDFIRRHSKGFRWADIALTEGTMEWIAFYVISPYNGGTIGRFECLPYDYAGGTHKDVLHWDIGIFQRICADNALCALKAETDK